MNISQYLPELPECPKIPLPESVQPFADRLSEIQDESVSPLIQRLNLIIICLSLICILAGRSVSDYLVFMPSHIVSFSNEAAPT